MANFARPGVYIQEVALQQAVQPANTANAVGAFAGALPKGPTTAPVLVSTWTDFVKAFGGLNDSYPTTWAAYNFFANGGRNLYVKRVVGSGSATGSLIINDGTGTTTTATATVTAASAASGTITYTATNTFNNIAIYKNGSIAIENKYFIDSGALDSGNYGLSISGILEANGSTDYFELYGFCGSARNVLGGEEKIQFSGMKVIT